MSAKLRCPNCVAFRTPDEVDFEHTPVRCKECGTAIEVFDDQLEALDKQLAMTDRQSEMLEPLPSYPIYPPDNTQVTDSDSQTPLTRMLQILIGNRETISRSATSGIVSYFFVTAFFAVIAQFNLFDLNVERLYFNPTGWPTIICGLLFFAIFGGRPIGWLFIRPVANILHITCPELDPKRVWIISTVSVWLSIVILALYPYQQLPPLLQGGLLIAVLVWVAISGIIGGFLGAIAPIGKGPKEGVQYLAVGGAVTGSLLMSFQILMSLILSSTLKPFNGPENVVKFCLLVTVVSFVSMFPYILIVPLSAGASKLIRFGEEFHLAYVLIGGIVWAAIGYLGGGNLFMDATSVDGLVLVGVMGLCGACGGWATGQFMADA
jgi:hypothetical protein